jgi:hypothetical protein
MNLMICCIIDNNIDTAACNVMRCRIESTYHSYSLYKIDKRGILDEKILNNIVMQLHACFCAAKLRRR